MTREQILLVKVQEECAEVAQRAAKALQFGPSQIQQPDEPGHSPASSQNPDMLDNRERLIHEYNDLIAVMQMLGMDDYRADLIEAKKIKIEKYLLKSFSLGILKPQE